MKFYFHIFLFLSFHGISQIDFLDHNKVVDSFLCCNSLTEKKIFLTGEFHDQKSNFQTQFSFLQELNSDQIFPEYILLEQGFAFSYIMNKYISDTLYHYGYPLFFTKREIYPFYLIRTQPSAFNSGRKINFIGVDFERDISYTVEALNILFKKIAPTITEKTCSRILTEDNDLFTIHLNSLIAELKEYNLYLPARGKMFNTLSELDSLYLNSKDRFSAFLNEELKDFKLILDSYKRYIEYSYLNYEKTDGTLLMKREINIANTVYNLHCDHPEAILFGQFGLAHVNLINSNRYMKTNFTSFCELLNTKEQYASLNNKICSGVILYKHVQPKHYPYLDRSILKELKNKKKSALNLMIIQDKYTPFFNCILLCE